MKLVTLVMVGAWVGACGSTAPVAITSLASTPRFAVPPVPAAQTIRVMSYNVNFGLAGDPVEAAAIELGQPDVVVLQETNDEWEALFVDKLPQFAHHRFGAPRGLPAGGLGVLSRFPIVSIDELPSVNGPFFAWRIVVDAPIGRIQIVNVHLRPPMSDSGSWVVGFFSTREDRERELGWHLARIDPHMPTVVAGDFNEENDGRAMAVAERLGYVDAIAQFGGAVRTWQWPVGGLVLRFQLDHILYDARLTAVASGVIQAGRSDHKPIWADIQRTPP